MDLPCTSDIFDLPAEVLEYILCDRCLNFKDVCNLSSTCSHFRSLCNNKEIWRVKFNQRYPVLFDHYTSHEHYDWQSECRQQVELVPKVSQCLEQISIQNHERESLSDEAYDGLVSLLSGHPQAHWCLANGLKEILCADQSDRKKNRKDNLTHQYYATMALPFVKRCHILHEWERYLQLPADEQSLEQGVVMLSQWFQSTEDISQQRTAQQLNRLADLVVTEIEKKYPHHPLTSNRSPTGLCDTGMLPPSDVRTVLQVMGEILPHHIQAMKGVTISKYLNMTIKSLNVMSYGLSLAFVLVAQRLGISLHPVIMFMHSPHLRILLRWKEHPELPDDLAQYTYYDFNDGYQFLTAAQCISMLHFQTPFLLQVRPVVEILKLLTMELLQFTHGEPFMMQLTLVCLEMYHLLDPRDISQALSYAHLQLQLNINPHKTLKLLTDVYEAVQAEPQGGIVNLNYQQLPLAIDQARQDIAHLELSRQNQVVVRRRQEEGAELGVLKYSVGMIMKHQKYDYLCVVSGWDHCCTANRRWRSQMGIDSLPRQERQPFYNVLVEDSSNRYAAEDNLVPAPSPQEVSHPEVGRFFQSFCGAYYLPNSGSCQRYPDDLEHTKRTIRDTYGMDSVDS